MYLASSRFIRGEDGETVPKKDRKNY